MNKKSKCWNYFKPQYKKTKKVQFINALQWWINSVQEEKKKDFHHDSIPMSWSFWSMKCRTCLDFEKVRMQIQTVEWVTPRRRPNILFSPLMAGSVVRMVSRDLAAMMDKMVVMKNKIIWMIIKAAPNRTKFVILMCAESLPESYLNPIKKFLSSFL